MIDPLFWLGLSILLVAVSLTAVLVAALPALQELARAARSAEKLFDTLRRELPPTLEAIRLTGLEISDLTDDVSEGVKSAGQVVKQVDQSLSGAKNQAKKVQVNTRGVVAGVKAAWKTWNRPSTGRKSVDRLPPSQRKALDLHESETSASITSADNVYRELDADLDDTDQNTSETFYKDIKDSLPQRQYEDVEQPDESSDY
ncbi:DUF948 domain-containing protein [Microcoleus sp. FACHB-SPT15]|uniref:DUF948 domain-containing protein n=1 Tax=Microcoleus sp. FACHB-SPT15 TaxID=2692830 RepID=UPI001781EBAB|nr:DUF948 domain-containing protein [Microcoleus sp. FACHB-SPT15]MBD1809620.1 DUF948 domain-containing protein [Microcoleus sp. FACHB-SPT15]